MKRLFALAALALLSMPACAGMFQSTAQVVDPVGPMMISVPAGTVQHTTTTVNGNGVYMNGSAGNDEIGVNQEVYASDQGIAGNMQAGSLVGHSEVSATGMSTTIVDQATGETVSLQMGFPGMVPPPTTSVTTTTVTTDAMVEIECGMSLESHAELLETIRANENATMTLGTILNDAAASNRLTTAQVIAVLKTLGYEMQRSDAAVAFYPNVCDPGNWFKIYNVVGPATADDIKDRISHGGRRSNDNPYGFDSDF